MLRLLLGLVLVTGLALAAAPTPITVTTNAGALSGSVDVLNLCAASSAGNCMGTKVICPVPITVSGPNRTVKANCKTSFTVVGFQFALTVQNTDGTYTQIGGGTTLVNGTATVTDAGTTGTLTLKVGK